MQKRYRLTAAALAVLLTVMGATTGWTLAWLTADPQSVKNTFTVGKVRIRLEETMNFDADGDGAQDAWQRIMVPGTELTKDPRVTVLAGSEDCWVFVHLNEEGWLSEKLNYELYEGWIQLPGEENTYYRPAARKEQEQVFPVLLENCVSVSDDFTKEDGKNIGRPKLGISAYAVQQAGFASALDAWKEVAPDA